ncbi:MAG: ECF-type sigma factor [Holophagales bacterium]|nr:ECF-type sigma factor [Holophagales bacterium]
MRNDDITGTIRAWREGRTGAVQALTRQTLGELRRIAGMSMRDERPGHTLEPSALVNELFLRLASTRRPPAIASRSQFFAFATRAMRRILVDHARGRARKKRGGADRPIVLSETELEGGPGILPVVRPQRTDALGLRRALEKLGRLSPRLRTIVELRYFGGLTAEQVSRQLEVSLATVHRDWRCARTWLFRELHRPSSESPEHSSSPAPRIASVLDSIPQARS